MESTRCGLTTLNSWVPLDEVFGDESLCKQVMNVCALNVIDSFALMPDTHPGFGMPIGGVATLHNAISPNMVGTDIGCGMRATKTDMDKADFKENEAAILHEVRRAIPVGMGMNRTHYVEAYVALEDIESLPKDKRDYMRSQIGTLGGGNHFIEYDYDEDGRVWVVVHSGSRNLGQVVNKFYHKLALDMSHPLTDPDLAYFVEDETAFDSYVNDMGLALAFATENRAAMATDAVAALGGARILSVQDNHHNFANRNADGLWVHRKGATGAALGEDIVIPMNMGDGIVIGKGRGSAASLDSCSHGAGRAMGRNAAKKTLDRAAEEKYLSDRGITLEAAGDALDEMPHAYKDSETVMARQADLVEITHWLKPLAVVKG